MNTSRRSEGLPKITLGSVAGDHGDVAVAGGGQHGRLPQARGASEFAIPTASEPS